MTTRVLAIFWSGCTSDQGLSAGRSSTLRVVQLDVFVFAPVEEEHTRRCLTAETTYPGMG